MDFYGVAWRVFAAMYLCFYWVVHVEFDIISDCCGRRDIGGIGRVDLFTGNVAGCSFRARDYVLVWNVWSYGCFGRRVDLQ